MLVLSNDEVYIKTGALWLAFVVIRRRGIGMSIPFKSDRLYCQDANQKKKKTLKLTFQFGQPIPDQDISSCTPHPYIVTVLSLSNPDGCVTTSLVNGISEARWPGTEGFRKHPRKAERPCTLFEIRSGWRHLLLGHPWRSHTC